MNMNWLNYRFAFIAIVALMLAACGGTSDEEKIAQAIATMKEAVESKSFTGIEKHLSNDFVANERLDKTEVERLLRMYSLRHKQIGATIIGSKTTMDATFLDRAETTLSVVVTGSSGRLPSDGSVRTVKLQWVKLSGDWQVRRATWRH